jgi:Fic family protein
MPTVRPHPRYVWQHPAWPQVTFDAAALAPALDQARLELDRLLEAGHVGSGGGFLGGMTTEKYAKITGTSKATATRDLADLLAHGLLRVEGVG